MFLLFNSAITFSIFNNNLFVSFNNYFERLKTPVYNRGFYAIIYFYSCSFLQNIKSLKFRCILQPIKQLVCRLRPALSVRW